MTTTITNNQGRIRSPSLAKYIKIVKQANERTAEQYEYRLSKFEKYLATVSEEEGGQHQQSSEISSIFLLLGYLIVPAASLLPQRTD